MHGPSRFARVGAELESHVVGAGTRAPGGPGERHAEARLRQTELVQQRQHLLSERTRGRAPGRREAFAERVQLRLQARQALGEEPDLLVRPFQTRRLGQREVAVGDDVAKVGAVLALERVEGGEAGLYQVETVGVGLEVGEEAFHLAAHGAQAGDELPEVACQGGERGE